MSAAPPKPRVVIYCRISSDDENRGEGVARQEADCLAYVERHGFELVEAPLVENNVSAYDLLTKREKYQYAVELFRLGQIDGIVTWSTDRLYRRLRDLLQLINVWEDTGNPLLIYSTQQGKLDLSSSTGRMVASVLGAVATQEADVTSERLIRQKLDRAMAGQYAGGQPPFGYRKGERGEKDGGIPLEIHPVNGPAFAEAVRAWLADDSKNLSAAARQLSEACGQPISREAFRLMLRNPAYVAERRHFPAAAKRKARAADEPTSGFKTPPSGMTTYPAAWPPLLEKLEFLECARVLDDPARKTAERPYQAKYLLAGFLWCKKQPDLPSDHPDHRPHCDHRMGHHRGSYRCVRRGGAREACGHGSASAVALEDCVERAVLQRIAEMRVQQSDPAAVDSALARRLQLEAERLDVREGLGDLLKQRARGVYTAEQIAASELIYLERQRKIDAELAKLAHLVSPDLPAYDHAELTALFGHKPDEENLSRNQRREIADRRRAERQATLIERRAVLASLINEVHVYPSSRRGPVFDENRVVIWWRGNPEPPPRSGVLAYARDTSARAEQKRRYARERRAREKAAALEASNDD